MAESGWFAARPSGTESIYKIYAESFRGADHLRRIIEEAQAIVSKALAEGTAASEVPGQDKGEGNTMNAIEPTNPRILTINGGSSSIKFALFEAGDSLRRILEGGIERIGLPEATLRVKGVNQADNFSRPVTAPDHTAAVGALMDWIEERSGRDALTAVGHRVVHGGPKYSKPQRITAEMVTGTAPAQSIRS